MSFIVALLVGRGLSELTSKIIVWAVIVVIVVGSLLVVRQHYVNLGYDRAIADVKKQDERAVSAANKVKKKADDCAANSWWDVISQSCKTGE